MITLATEFPVKSIPFQSDFIAQVFSWLRGTDYSTVLDHHRTVDSDIGYFKSETLEELNIRELKDNNSLEAIGFRHDFPDGVGRLWRTEAVLRRAAAHNNQDLIRLRTQCIALNPGARLETPRKPYLIKNILNDRWGGEDGQLRISDCPLFLSDDAASLEIARLIILGQATWHLPVIYVSATATEKWLISDDQIKKLAFRIGGIAHVVVEPNRTFSFQLRDLTDGANVYGGTLAVILPGKGIVRRLYIGLRLPDMEQLPLAAYDSATSIRSQMPAAGWDWTELQEQVLRRQRERERSRLSAKEAEKLYNEEIANLKDRIAQLEGQLAERLEEDAAAFDDELLPAVLVTKLGSEIYPGEFSDRLRLAAKECKNRADQIGLDPRSKAVFDAIETHLPPSPALFELFEDLKRATKDSRRLASEMVSLLSRHGYREKSDNKHIRLEAKQGYEGLDTITLPKTPSDARGLTNLRTQVERTLGISKLSK